MPRGRGPRKPPVQKKPPLTHFLCLPLVTAASKPQLEASLQSFRDDVSFNESTQTDEPSPTLEGSTNDVNQAATRIHPKAIRPVGVLHCTLGVMSLNEEQLNEAITLLKSIDVENLLSTAAAASNPEFPNTQPTDQTDPPSSLSTAISPPPTAPKPLRIDLKSLTSMHAPRSTSILYTAPADPSLRLHPFCLALQSLFRAQNLLVPDSRPLKLHATLVNTIYAKGRGRGSGHGPDANALLKFDARGLLERYEGCVWAAGVVLDRVAICEMGARKVVGEGGVVLGEEYVEVASVGLPRG
ncbi:hypothetical protein WHR41_05996 [Cladosporium halotolerans]|uniref:A-kinase anchor protein 7-like phosphoesterase domain-containing protein n=1 Tax=Cladosporium halotolerans TaxID=1052096 RepID=A0AB34KKG7_9PEZI